MRQLRFVKPAADGEHLVLETADGGEEFQLDIGAALRDAVRSDLPRRSGIGPDPEQRIGPREIQMRIRAGESPQDLAEANGARMEWVMRFATPVLAERVRIADEARRGRARRSTTEGQTVVFGAAVEQRFAAHGLDPAEVRWDARRREDGQWVVSAHWLGSDIDRKAEWSFQLRTRTVAPLDDAAAELLSDRPIRPIAAPGPARLTLAVAPPPAPDSPGRGARADSPTGRPAFEEVFDQAAFDVAPEDAAGDGGPEDVGHEDGGPEDVGRGDVGHEDGGPEDVGHGDGDPDDALAAAFLPSQPDAGFETLPLPLRVAEDTGAPASREATGRVPRVTNLGVAPRDDEPVAAKPRRPQVPAWDDILLGVRRKTD